ncbi:hypothetical protein LTR85_000978 [Meristemomyces frigidus]|nr:hypothetical protein LTR85_000978 [Meristemomyces frigidus]
MDFILPYDYTSVRPLRGYHTIWQQKSMARSRKSGRSQAGELKLHPNPLVSRPKLVPLPFPCRKNHFGVDFAMPLGEEINYEGGAARVGRGMAGAPAQYIGGWLPRRADLTVADMRVEYDCAMMKWKGSKCRKEVIQMLETRKPVAGWQITEAIYLGSGSWSRYNPENKTWAGPRSMAQFVAFMDVVAYFTESAGAAPIKIFAQDPKYTPLDWEFLATLGVAVVKIPLKERRSDGSIEPYDGPDAVRLITPSSFVCELCIEYNDAFLETILAREPQLVIGSMIEKLATVRRYLAWHEEQLIEAQAAEYSGDDDCDCEDPKATRVAFLEGTLAYYGLNERLMRKYGAEPVPEYEEDDHESLLSIESGPVHQRIKAMSQVSTNGEKGRRARSIEHADSLALPTPALPSTHNSNDDSFGNEVCCADTSPSIRQEEDRGPTSVYDKDRAPAEDTDIASVFAEYEHQMNFWRQSECRGHLTSLLDRQTPSGGWQVDKAVCLATGSFSRGDTCESRFCRSALYRLAVFTDLVSYLQISSEQRIQLFAQDPAYSALDSHILECLGVTAFQVPGNSSLEDCTENSAREQFGPSSFICELGMKMKPWFPQALIVKQPKLVISSLMRDPEELKQKQEPGNIISHFEPNRSDTEYLALDALDLAGPKDEAPTSEREATDMTPDQAYPRGPIWESVQDVREMFDKAVVDWQRSPHRINLLNILDEKAAYEGWRITKAICLATGSLHRWSTYDRRRSLYQLAAFLDTTDHLSQPGVDIERIAQDPEYRKLDFEFLESLNVTAIRYFEHRYEPIIGPDGPSAFDHFTPTSFVCEFYMGPDNDFVERLIETQVPLVLSSMDCSSRVELMKAELEK